MKWWKRLTAGLLAAVICLIGPAFTIYADESEDEAKKAAEEALAKEKAEVLALPIETNALTGWPQGPGVYANSAIVMDINSGAILYGKRIDEQHYPASITKILTVLVALENGELTDEVIFSQASVDFLEYGDAQIGMRPGEIISLEDALYAVLLASANEVSYAVAENIGIKMCGDYDTFIQEMNDRAIELGCTGSHWTNANGLHNEEHYTTAHDMALIGAEVYGWDQFRKTTQTLQHTIPPTNLVDEQRTFQQNHKMLYESNQYYYEYCTGGKTGFTDQARTTLVTFADNGDMQLVAVNLRSYGAQVYVDTKAMFDYAFTNFSKVSVEEYKDEEKVDKYLTDDAYVVLPEGISVDQLETSYEVVDGDRSRQAVLEYTYEGQPVGNIVVILTRDYYDELTGHTRLQVRAVEEPEEESAKPLKTVGIAIGIVIALVIVVTVVLFFIRKNKLQNDTPEKQRSGKKRSKKK